MKLVSHRTFKYEYDYMNNWIKKTWYNNGSLFVIDERKIEEAIERMYRSEQQDMFDDPDMNWSGLR